MHVVVSHVKCGKLVYDAIVYIEPKSEVALRIHKQKYDRQRYWKKLSE